MGFVTRIRKETVEPFPIDGSNKRQRFKKLYFDPARICHEIFLKIHMASVDKKSNV
jgi:hypothetical protein